MKYLNLLMCFLLVACAEKDPHIDPGVPISNGDLVASFRSNEGKHGFSGIASLFHNQAPFFSPFDRENAGLNFEHIISGHNDPRNAFTPRLQPLKLVVLPTGVDLIKSREDEPWNIPWVVRYRLVSSHYIDFQFETVIDDPSLFDPEGYAAFFFASYMTDVSDTEINFRGYRSFNSTEDWVRSSPTSAAGESYIAREAIPLQINSTNSLDILNLKNEPYPRIAKPFYYGLLSNGFVYAVMFDRLYTERDEIRFTVFRWNAGKGKPAWDFCYVVKDLSQPNIKFRGRLVYKPFVSPQDIEQEYENWRKTLN